jgi:hypothetical protein
MSNYEENWKRFLKEDCWEGYEQQGMKKKGDRMVPNCVPISEETRDTYDSEVVDRNKKSRQKGIAVLTKEEKEDLLPKIVKALRDEGGAAGMDALKKHTGSSKGEIDDAVDAADNIKIHKDGDYILMDSLNEEDEILDENGIPLAHVHEEGKICPKGKAWAMRKYGKWSAYAAMGASKYCKDPNYGKGKKKDESLHKEGELKKWREENWVQSDGTPCGDAKAQKSPKRCKPASKWASMSKGEKKADDAKKKAGGKKGKQFVSATKKGKVTKKHTKESKDMKITVSELNKIVREVIEETVYYHIADATYDDGTLAEDVEFWDDVLEEAEYQGRKVTLNKPMQGDVKKSKVYVKNAKGNVVKVNFGDKKMRIKKSNPKRRKSFRARHNCDNPGPKWKARYWSCRAW